MATPQVIVSRHVRVMRPDGLEAAQAAREQDVEISLDGDRRAYLRGRDDKAAGYARVLAGLEQLGEPVYLEVDDTDGIDMLRIPLAGLAGRFRDTRDGVEFELSTSQTRFRLKKSDDRFEGFSQILREAEKGGRPVLLTADDLGEIVDIRFFEPGPDDGPFPDFPFRRPYRLTLWDWIWRWPLWPWNWWWGWGCISPATAQNVFNQMAATTCAPLTIPPPCIPFLYPDDGCWARAHEMARLMIAMGLSPRKVWISGNLHTLTRNNPACFVDWGWHVAPTLCVRRRWWWWPFLWWGARRMVIDPSLFTTPVTVDHWKSVQGDPGAILTHTDASDYLWGETDPTYSKTNNRLAFYRLRLQTRAINSGPPPYAHCP